MRQLKLIIAAFFLISPMAANADLIRIDFTANGFDVGAPFGAISGSITWVATSVNATIDSLVSIDLTIGSHTYLLSEVGYISPFGVDEDVIGGLACSVSCMSGISDDFWMYWDRTTHTPIQFAYASPAGVSHYFSTNFDSFVISTVPEPGTLALFGIGLAGMGLARRRQKA